MKNPKTDGNEYLLENDDHQEDTDLMAVRVVEEDGRKFRVIADGQYALWTIQWDSGPVPKVLDGQFTSPDEANNALKAYLSAKKTKKA